MKSKDIKKPKDVENKLQELFTVKSKDIENVDESQLLAKLNEEEVFADEVDNKPVDMDELFKRVDMTKTNKRIEDVEKHKRSGNSNGHQKTSGKVRGLVNEDYLKDLLEDAVDAAIEKHIDRIITGVANMISMMQNAEE